MESGNRRKLSGEGEVEPSKENKKIKISFPTHQGLNSTCSMSMEEAKEKTCEKKQQQQQHNIQFMKTFKTREKARDSTNNDSPKRKTGSPHQIAIDEACSNSQKQLINSEKLLKENQSCLRARVEELRNETYWLCSQLVGLSKMCMRTRESNTNLLENLKMYSLGPEVIHALEEKNPDPDPQTDHDQRTGTPN